MNAAFLDTDILIYAHLEVVDDPRCERAPLPADFDTLRPQHAGHCRILGADDPAEAARRRHLRQCGALLAYDDVRDVSSSTLRTAWGVRQRYGFSYRDSQIVASALEAGCDTLYTEDLQHGQTIEKRLTLINPLLGD